MKSLAILVFGLMVTAQQPPALGKVDTEFDKKTDFAAIHTYTLTKGTNALRPDAHKLIVAAVEKELAGLGLKPVASGADVTVAYYALTASYVDLKALDKMDDKSQPAPTKELGKLAVIMRNPAHQQVWSALSREFLDNDLAKLPATIQTVTERLFAAYPTRAKK